MIQDIKSGKKCLLGGLGNITCGFQGGSRVFTFSLEGGGVRLNLGNESRSPPAPP